MREALVARLERGLGSGPARVLTLFLLGAFIALQNPRMLLEGRFWHEEGVVFFAAAWNEGLAAFFDPFKGYYLFLARAAAELATHVPLVWASHVTLLISLAVMLLPSALLLFAPLDADVEPWRRPPLALAVVLPYTGLETWLTTTNAQSWLILAACILLVTDPRPRRYWALAAGVLLLCGLTGPYIVFVTPLFVLRALRTRSGAWWGLAGLALLCSLFQGWHMLGELRGATVRDPGGNLAFKLLTVPVRLGLYPFLASYKGTASALIETRGGAALAVAALLGAAMLTAIAGIAWTTRARMGAWLCGAAIGVTLLAILGSLPIPIVGSDLLIFRPLPHARYFMSGTALLAVILLLPSAARAPRAAWVLTRARVVLLASMAAGGLHYYVSVEDTGPGWRADAAAWQSGRAGPPRVWPYGVRVNLDPSGPH